MFYPCGSILAILFKVVKTLFDFSFEAAVSLHHVELEDFLLAGLFLIVLGQYYHFLCCHIMQKMSCHLECSVTISTLVTEQILHLALSFN